MKLALFVGLIAITLTGCSSYNSGMGATGDEYYNGGSEVGFGSAGDVRSPGGLDRARGPKVDPTLPPDNGGNNPY